MWPRPRMAHHQTGEDGLDRRIGGVMWPRPRVATAVRLSETCNGPAAPYGWRPDTGCLALDVGTCNGPRRAMRETCAPAPGDAHRTAPGVTMANRTGAGGPPGLETAGMEVRGFRPDSTGRGWTFADYLRHRGQEKLEAPPGLEPGMEVLQTSALPLGDGAVRTATRAARGRQPLAVTRRAGAAVRAWRGADRPRRRKMERETGFEPATSTMARSHSTTELFPLAPNAPSKVPQGEASLQGLSRPECASDL